VAMQRAGGGSYKIETILTPLHTVARETKDLPLEWIENGNNISAKYIEYAKPIVGALPAVGTFDEIK